jgi:two-component system chemotaxis sensor kinase CheA
VDAWVDPLADGPVEDGVLWLAFTVEDTGIGIPPDRRDRLFQAFSQVDSSTTRRYGGTGLGLVICQSLVRLMGGEIEVESEVGKGSTFGFTIRTHRAPDAAAYVPPALPPGLAGKRVLIVDDDVRNVFSITSVLEDHGMDVSFAENGKDALRLLEENPQVDLVLMDVMMPEMDGYETTRRIREQEALKVIPIIALTAKAMKGDREKCIAAGASDYITKPVDPEQLLSLMRVWLYR